MRDRIVTEWIVKMSHVYGVGQTCHPIGVWKEVVREVCALIESGWKQSSF